MSDEAHAGLPVAGYRPTQSTTAVEIVNRHKCIEEEALRALDRLVGDPDIDQRALAVGRTQMQSAWMWINRSVFQPLRVQLPGDPL